MSIITITKTHEVKWGQSAWAGSTPTKVTMLSGRVT